jgi:hypothetical protein
MNLTICSQFSRPVIGPRSSASFVSASSVSFYAELFFQQWPRLLRSAPLQLFHQIVKERAVEFLCLSHAHPMHFESDNIKATAREQIDDPAGTRIGKTKIIGLDKDQGLLDLRRWREFDDTFQQTAFVVGMRGPQVEIETRARRCGRGEHRRFEVGYVAVLISDVVAISVAKSSHRSFVR